MNLVSFYQDSSAPTETTTQGQQKALSFSVLDELAKRQVTELDEFIAQLTIGATFFACRSCEYSRFH
jgi:hypothetical protein